MLEYESLDTYIAKVCSFRHEEVLMCRELDRDFLGLDVVEGPNMKHLVFLIYPIRTAPI